MASYPCSDDPTEVIEKIVSAKLDADKFDRFVNGGVTEEVQLGDGQPTPTLRNVVHLVKSAAADLDGSDVSGKFSDAANGGETLRTLSDRFGDIVNVKDFGAVGDGDTDDTQAIQDALDFAPCGTLIFPYGVYLIRDTIEIHSDQPCNGRVVELNDSQLVWIGAENGVMVKVYDRCMIRNGRISGASANYHEHVAGVCVRYMPQSAGYGAHLEVDQFNVAGIDCGEYRDTGTIYNGISSTKLFDVYVHAGIYGAGGAMSGSGGPTGIRLIGDDNKIIQASIQQCRYGFEVVGTGNKIDGYYFYSSLADEQDIIVPGCAPIHYAYSDRVAGDQLTGSNMFSSCYFDYPNYIIYNDKGHQTITSIVNSFVLGFPQPTNNDPSYNVYMMNSHASPLIVNNFVNNLGQHVNFYSAKASIAFSHRDISEITEHYARSNRTLGSNSDITPFQAVFQVESGESVSVCNTYNASSGEYYFIGGVLSASVVETPSFDVFVGQDRSDLTQMTLHCINDNGTFSFVPESIVTPDISWWGIAVGQPASVSILGETKYFTPIYVHFYSSATSINLTARIDLKGINGVIFLKNRANSLDFTSSSYICDIKSAQGASDKTSNYAYTQDYNVTDFDSATAKGVWKVGWASSASNAPDTTNANMMGLLEVFVFSPHGNVTNADSVMQRVTLMNGNPGATHVRRRLNGTWSSWVAGS